MHVGSDYTAKSNFRINFPPTGRARIRIPIINDDIAEMTERFIGNLKTTDLEIRIQQSMAQVDITDSDGTSRGLNLDSDKQCLHVNPGALEGHDISQMYI